MTHSQIVDALQPAGSRAAHYRLALAQQPFKFDMQKAYLERIRILASSVQMVVPALAELIAALQKNQEDLVAQTSTTLLRGTYDNELGKFYAALKKVTGLTSADLELAEGLYVWQELNQQESYSTESTFPTTTVVQTDTFLAPNLTRQLKQEWLQIHSPRPPVWFSSLPIWAQAYLRNIVPQELLADWSHIQRTLPTELRCLPGVANYTEHSLTITSADFNLQTNAYRYGVPSAFNIPSQARATIANLNMEQIMQEVVSKAYANFQSYWGLPNLHRSCPVLVAGLLTTKEQGSWFYPLVALYKNRENEERMTHEKHRALTPILDNESHLTTQDLEFFNLNIAINGVRDKTYEFSHNAQLIRFLVRAANLCCHIHNLTTNQTLRPPGSLSEIQAFCHTIEDQADPKFLKLIYLNRAILALHNMLKVNPRGRNKALYIAALLDVITRLMGGASTGHCKSSKDRKSIELLTADSMLVYLATTGEVPLLNDTLAKRQRFIGIFRQLFMSGHQQTIAAANNPGVYGIKDEAEGIIDADIRQALGQDYYLSRELAELNRPGRILSIKRKWLSILISTTIGLAVFATCLALFFTGIFVPPVPFLIAGLSIKATGVVISAAISIIASAIGFGVYKIPSNKTFASQKAHGNLFTRYSKNIIRLELGVVLTIGLISLTLMLFAPPIAALVGAIAIKFEIAALLVPVILATGLMTGLSLIAGSVHSVCALNTMRKLPPRIPEPALGAKPHPEMTASSSEPPHP